MTLQIPMEDYAMTEQLAVKLWRAMAKKKTTRLDYGPQRFVIIDGSKVKYCHPVPPEEGVSISYPGQE